MSDNYDGPQMAQTIIRLQAQLDARRRIGKYVSFRLVGDENANPQDAADKVMKLIDEIETIAVNDKSGCLRCTEIVNLIHWTLRSDEARWVDTEPMVTYSHVNDPTGVRFRQYKKDPLPPWAVDVRDEPIPGASA